MRPRADSDSTAAPFSETTDGAGSATIIANKRPAFITKVLSMSDDCLYMAAVVNSVSRNITNRSRPIFQRYRGLYRTGLSSGSCVSTCNN